MTDALDKDYEVVAGTYSVSETVPTGWDQTGNTCSGVVVGAGATVTCQITNAKRGHLIVQKTTNPAGDPTVFSINASGSGLITGGGAGTVTDAADYNYEVTPGTYSVSETVLANWAQTGNTCSSVVVAAGANVTCEITNTMKGHLIVTKVTEPASDTSTQFPVTANGSGTVTAPAARTLTGNGGSTDYEVTAGVYSVAENVPAGWSQTGNTCQNVIVPPGQTVNCRISNSQFGHLVVVKQVINDNGGTQPPSAFTMSVTGNSPSPASFPGGSTTVALIAGSYAVSESGPSGYASSFSADCSGSIAGGETKTCTVTNDDIQPKLIVIKVVVNDNGGTATPSSFTMNVTGNGPSPSSFAGGSGTTVALNAGSYSVSEIAQVAYAASFSADCSGSIAVGETKTCTIINDDIAPKLIVIKHVVNNDGRTAVAANFTMSVTGGNPTPASFPGAEAPGTQVALSVGSYSVTETGPQGYAASFSADCSGTIALGQTKTCTITNNDIPVGLPTSSELCKFDVDPLPGSQFLLNFKQNSGNNYTLNASNPGQFYYNVVTGSAGTLTMTLPYPFVTSGTTPIHVYTQFQWDENTKCFKPGTPVADSSFQVTMSSYKPNAFGSTATVTVSGVPAGAYVNIHLDYGLKGTDPYSKVGNDAKKGSLTITNGQSYSFSDSAGGGGSTSSLNKFGQ